MTRSALEREGSDVLLRDLTTKQEDAESVLATQESMPLQEVCQRMGMNRNDIVKLLHDARQHQHLAQHER